VPAEGSGDPAKDWVRSISMGQVCQDTAIEHRNEPEEHQRPDPEQTAHIAKG